MSAQVGTCEPVPDGVGEGDGLADGEAIRGAEAVGEVRALVLLVVPHAGAPQAAARITPASASNPSLRRMWLWNGWEWTGVTSRPRDTGAQGYGQPQGRREPFLAGRQAVLSPSLKAARMRRFTAGFPASAGVSRVTNLVSLPLPFSSPLPSSSSRPL